MAQMTDFDLTYPHLDDNEVLEMTAKFMLNKSPSDMLETSDFLPKLIDETKTNLNIVEKIDLINSLNYFAQINYVYTYRYLHLILNPNDTEENRIYLFVNDKLVDYENYKLYMLNIERINFLEFFQKTNNKNRIIKKNIFSQLILDINNQFGKPKHFDENIKYISYDFLYKLYLMKFARFLITQEYTDFLFNEKYKVPIKYFELVKHNPKFII